MYAYNTVNSAKLMHIYVCVHIFSSDILFEGLFVPVHSSLLQFHLLHW